RAPRGPAMATATKGRKTTPAKGRRKSRQTSATSSRRDGRARSDAELFEAFCKRLVVENGTPLVLYPAERVMLRAYFRGVRAPLVVVPKKNGKTTLLGALALFHLLSTANAACYIAAASRDQATILFEQAKGFVERSDWLAGEVSVKRGY